jgi:hypothetical protein
MGIIMVRTLPLLLLLVCVTGFAIEKPPEADTAGESAANSDDVLELDKMTVTGERLSLKQESRLRIIRHAFNEPRSSKEEDRDKLLCWLETPVGTHFRHVTCARNGDLEAVRLGGKDGGLGGSAGYGRHKFWRSMQADNEATVRSIMADLPDSGYFDQDFYTIASKGEEPPRDVPEVEELNRFSIAWIEVEKSASAGKDEGEVVAAIEAQGFTLKRYNRLVALTQSYPSIRAKMTELVIENQAQDS